MEYSYKFRIYPTREQEILIQRTFGCCWFVYNYYLAKRSEVLYDLMKSWFVHTVAQEPDVIDAAKKAFDDAVDSVAAWGGKSICEILDEQEKDGLK